MRNRVILIFAAVNALALAGGFYYVSQSIERTNAARPNTPKGAMVRSDKVAPLPPPKPETVVVYKTNRFDWSQIESADYRQYIANLRAIGCPEATIRDLVLTDVMHAYALKRGQFEHNGREFKYWETDEKRKPKRAQLEEREKQLALIDKELPSVLRELLGINYEREINKYFVDASDDDRRLAFLSEDKRSQLLALRDDLEGRRERIFDRAANGYLSAADMEDLRKVEAERAEMLGKILSPDEREQYELSTSETADRLRNQLIGFNPSEAEFKEIYKRQAALDAKYQYLDPQDESVRAAKAADEQQMEQELKQVMGDSRLTEFQRSTNEDYRNLCTITEQYELPASTTQTLQEMRQIAETERQKLLSDTQIPVDRRNKALKAIQTETESTFRQTLGEQAYNAYSQAGGGWIRGLGAN